VFLKRNIFLFLLFFPVFLFAQSKKVDSMIACLKNEGQDTNRVRTLNLLSDNIKSTDAKKANEYSLEAMTLARKIGYLKGILYASQVQGFILQAQGKTKESIELYKKTLAECEKSDVKRSLAAVSTRLGFSYIANGENSEALLQFKHSIAIADSIKSYDFVSDAYRGMGMVYASLGEHALATQSFISAIENAEKAGNSDQQGYAYITLGNSQQNQKDYDNALISFTKALKLLEETKDGYGIAGCYISIGNIYMFKNDFENAIKNYEQCIQMRKEMNDEAGVAMAEEDIGSILNLQNKPELALKYIEHGLDVFRRLNNQQGIAGALDFLGNSYTEMGKYQEAETAYLEALSIARTNHLNDWIKDAYSGLSKVYFLSEKYKDAYLFKDSTRYIDSIIIGEEHAEQSKEMEAKFENRKKEDEIAHLNVVNAEKDQVERKQKQIIIAVSAGLGIVLLLAFFLVRINAERRKANLLLGEQNKIIAEKNKDITDSINYASRIQKSVMPDEKILMQNIDDYFIFNRPRDIVSGDFFWLAQKGDRTYIAVADCTGHGVPGALVSVIGINMLNKIIEREGIPSPSEMLEQLHLLVISALNKDTTARDTNDGMDVGLLCIDKKSRKAYFSSGGRPLYYSNKNNLQIIKSGRYSIAGEKKVGDEPFSEVEIPIDGPTSFYLFSDGYADQFGEASGKKYLSKRFQDLLSGISSLSMKEQGKKVENEFENWKGKLEQVDDVLVIGINV
jgi:tetratricopeptide (TPR) repeat protein